MENKSTCQELKDIINQLSNLIDDFNDAERYNEAYDLILASEKIITVLKKESENTLQTA